MSSLDNYTKVPAKNIYYMLCYAWNRLKEKDRVKVSSKDDKDIQHLLTRILIEQLRVLIKKGFYREYVNVTEETSLLRGKIDFPTSIQRLTHIKGRMKCSHDELSYDILHNQIIKSTLHGLLSNESLDKQLKDKISTLFPSFHTVSQIRLTERLFKEATIHRSNQHYGFVMDICYFLYESMLLNEETGKATFTDFERYHREMAALFEQFVRNFYKAEAPNYRVFSENITWDAVGENTEFLPIMKTDISLENDTHKIIMDTKFYHQALSVNYGAEKIISNNLYQLYTYLNHERKAPVHKEKVGILLYPKTDKEVDLTYTMQQYLVKVCTVDLNSPWQEIHDRLLAVVDMYREGKGKEVDKLLSCSSNSILL